MKSHHIIAAIVLIALAYWAGMRFGAFWGGMSTGV